MRYPDVIFLTGTSSAGKSSIAVALQRRLEPAHYFHFSLDNHLFELSAVPIQPEHVPPHEYERMISGFHRSVAAFVAAGNRVVVDHVCRKKTWLQECADLFSGCDSLLVRVRCSLAELERRERQRSDRNPGLARWQFSQMDHTPIYDLEVETHEHTTKECVEAIARAVESETERIAFSRIRSRSAR